MENRSTFERFLAVAAERNGRKAGDGGGAADHPLLNEKERKKLLKEHGPGVLNADSLRRMHKFVFHPNVRTLEEARTRHQVFIDAADDAQTRRGRPAT